MAKTASPILPPSVTPPGVAWATTLSFLAAVTLVWAARPFDSTVAAALFILGVMIAATFATDLLVYRVHLRASTGMDYRRSDFSLQRGMVKILGLYGVVGFLGFLYAILPVYDEPLYQPFLDLMHTLALPFLLLAAPYMLWVDRHQTLPEDGYWHMGNLILLRLDKADRGAAWAMLRGWLVKGFFLPLMFGFFCQSTGRILDAEPATFQDFVAVYAFLYTFAFFFDLSIATIGYMTTFRPLDTHMRSTEPTVLGWVVCLACYPPFWSFVSGSYLTYETDWEWGKWLWDHPLAYGLWGAAILACLGVYIYATAQFGCRFSNLTHRGIITSGPYRWTKHPSYIFKNISWWLIAIPFIPGDGQWETAVRNCFLLGCVNGIYYLRAKTEERHLMRDPDYAEYARWIEAHGMFRWLPRAMRRAEGAAPG